MEVTINMFDLEVMQSKLTMSYIFHKNLAIGLSVSKILIKYSCNNYEENDKKENETIDIDFTEQNADPEMMIMLLTLMIGCKRRRRGRYCFG